MHILVVVVVSNELSRRSSSACKPGAAHRSRNTALSVSGESIFNSAVSRITSCPFVLLLERRDISGHSGSVGGEVRRVFSPTIHPPSVWCVCEGSEAHACHWPVAGVGNVLFCSPHSLGWAACAATQRFHYIWICGLWWDPDGSLEHPWRHMANTKAYLKEPCTRVTVNNWWSMHL